MDNKLTAQQSKMITDYVLLKCSLEKDGGMEALLETIAKAGIAIPAFATLASAGAGGMYWLANRDAMVIDRMAKKRAKAIDAKLKELYSEPL